MSRQDELKMKRDVQSMVSIMDMYMSDAYVGSSTCYYIPMSTARVLSETMAEIIGNAQGVYSTKQIRAHMYNLMSTFSPNNTTILQILGHLHPQHRELSIMSENVLGSRKLGYDFDWARFIFPISMSNLDSRISSNDFNSEQRFMGSLFSLFIKRFLTMFKEDYTEILASYGRINHVAGRMISVLFPGYELESGVCISNNFDSIIRIIKINIIKSFLEYVDMGDLDTIVESVSESLGKEFAYSTVNEVYVVPFDKLRSFVEIFIYGLTKEYDVVYSILCNLIDTTNTVDENINILSELMNEYKKFEKVCVTNFKAIIGVDVLIEYIFDYLIEKDVTEVIDITTKTCIFNDSMSEIMKVKYFLDAEIECGSVTEPTDEEKNLKIENS